MITDTTVSFLEPGNKCPSLGLSLGCWAQRQSGQEGPRCPHAVTREAVLRKSRALLGRQWHVGQACHCPRAQEPRLPSPKAPGRPSPFCHRGRHVFSLPVPWSPKAP